MDLRERVLAASDAKEGTKRAIAKRFKVSEDWIYKLLRQRRELGTLEPQYHRRGRKAVFQGKSLKRLKALVDAQPDRTLEELRDLTGKSCSIMAVARALDRLGSRFKKRRSRRANKAARTSDRSARRGVVGNVETSKRRNEEKAWRIKTADHRRLIFIDESGAKTNMTRLYGRAFDGRRVCDAVPHGHWCTTTMVSAIGLSGPKAPFVFGGAMDAEAFRIYAERVLVPELQPGDIVVMDNLSSHKDAQAREMIERTGAVIWDLPPYSPDFNPIEPMWSKVKAFLRKAKARTEKTLIQAISDALTTITQDDCAGWFRHCGYLDAKT